LGCVRLHSLVPDALIQAPGTAGSPHRLEDSNESLAAAGLAPIDIGRQR
jgi:hypothetical protein